MASRCMESGVVVLKHVSCSMWNPPGLGSEPGIEPVSPALAGKYLTTGPPGKFRKDLFIYYYYFPLDPSERMMEHLFSPI